MLSIFKYMYSNVLTQDKCLAVPCIWPKSCMFFEKLDINYVCNLNNCWHWHKFIVREMSNYSKPCRNWHRSNTKSLISDFSRGNTHTPPPPTHTQTDKANGINNTCKLQYMFGAKRWKYSFNVLIWPWEGVEMYTHLSPNTSSWI
jgi:hypothetical protein